MDDRQRREEGEAIAHLGMAALAAGETALLAALVLVSSMGAVVCGAATVYHLASAWRHRQASRRGGCGSTGRA